MSFALAPLALVVVALVAVVIAVFIARGAGADSRANRAERTRAERPRFSTSAKLGAALFVLVLLYALTAIAVSRAAAVPRAPRVVGSSGELVLSATFRSGNAIRRSAIIGDFLVDHLAPGHVVESVSVETRPGGIFDGTRGAVTTIGVLRQDPVASPDVIPAGPAFDLDAYLGQLDLWIAAARRADWGSDDLDLVLAWSPIDGGAPLFAVLEWSEGGPRFVRSAALDGTVDEVRDEPRDEATGTSSTHPAERPN